jgi:hypothetical protein
VSGNDLAVVVAAAVEVWTPPKVSRSRPNCNACPQWLDRTNPTTFFEVANVWHSMVLLLMSVGGETKIGILGGRISSIEFQIFNASQYNNSSV